MVEQRNRIIVGDCVQSLSEFPDQFFHSCVFSPPYLGQRDYQVAGQIGRDKDADKYLSAMSEFFRALHRVMRRDSTVWMNIGDGYSKGQPMGLPWKLIERVRGEGWELRGEMIWQKPNKLPGSQQGRPTLCHESVFMLTRSGKGSYYFDRIAIAEKPVTKEIVTPPVGFSLLRMPRSVWTIPTSGYRGAHFAAFPEALAERCILSSTSEAGTCAACHAPYTRIVESVRIPTRPGKVSKIYADPAGSPYERHSGSIIGNRDPGRHLTAYRTAGWKPSCSCGVTETRPAIVLDPFAGSGTTLAVAARNGRDWVGIELSTKYAELIEQRIAKPPTKKSRRKS